VIPAIGRRESEGFDVVVSNPPYIAQAAAPTLQREVRDYEPVSALFGGVRGTEIYSRLIEQAATALRPRGILVLELGYGAADEVRRMFHVQQDWVNVSLTNDLAGIPRVIAAERA
jgi:release factor glutamine methyltransferase